MKEILLVDVLEGIRYVDDYATEKGLKKYQNEVDSILKHIELL